MAGNAEIATAYLAIVPTMDGVKKAIEAELGGVDAKGAGKRIGGSASSGFADAFKSAAATAAKAAAAATAAVGAAAAAVGKSALESYAQYEQLVGGVDKLFGDASGQLQKYAAEAYKTSGMSANQYMEQATSFSASLIQSLGGDTAKAAEQADVAMRAMSDNVNVFGSNMEDVQNAFQGFAKQNYTMLDNLKLGYGGTKEEMQRLIDDANEYAASIGQASDLSIDSFSDIVTAIELIQEQQGIAGTTAKEAAETIEGSVNMAKAAWQNWVTELGKDNADMAKLTTQLVTSVSTAASQVLPRIASIAAAATGALASVLPEAVESLAEVAGEYAPSLGESLMSLFSTAVGLVMEYLPGAAQQVVAGLSAALVAGGPDILAGAGDMLLALVDAVSEVLPMAVGAIAGLVTSLAQYLVEHMDEMLDSAMELVGTILTAIADNGPDILASLALVLASMVAAIGKKVGEFFDKGVAVIKGMWDGAVEKFGELRDWVASIPGKILAALGNVGSYLYDTGSQLINGFIDGAKSKAQSLISAVTGPISDAIGGAKRLLGIASPSKVFREIGGYTMQGLELGIEGGAAGAVAAMESAVGDVVGAGTVTVPPSPWPGGGASPASGAASAGTTYNVSVTFDISKLEDLLAHSGSVEELVALVSRARLMYPSRA